MTSTAPTLAEPARRWDAMHSERMSGPYRHDRVLRAFHRVQQRLAAELTHRATFSVGYERLDLNPTEHDVQGDLIVYGFATLVTPNLVRVALLAGTDAASRHEQDGPGIAHTVARATGLSLASGRRANERA